MEERANPDVPSTVDRNRRRWHFGRAILDERTHELFVDGIDAELERKPLEVLIYLLQHAGEVCTKDELLAGVWPGRVLSETVLTKCIGRLRDVLGDDKQEIIKTAYGFGYRFVAPVRVDSAPTPEPAHFDFHAGGRVPGRPLWSLVERLGTGGHGEAWRGRHLKTNEQRVFKFALDEPSLVALKREITLFRVINDTLGEEARVVKLLDWNLEQVPYFVETEFIAGGSLPSWTMARGGLAAMSLEDRLEIVAKIADAVAAVHSVGVLHKDLKPSNILVVPRGEGADVADIVLADFGSGGMLDPNRIGRLGITQLGFTKTLMGPEVGSGTPLYLAPEILAGQPFTVKADIFALGVILYQFVVGDLHTVMAPGWERGVNDELLREDIALVAEGNPAERLGDAGELARRIRSLSERHLQRDQEREARLRAERLQLALDRARAGRVGLALAFAFLVVGFGVSTLLYLRARDAQHRAERAAETTRAVSNFLSKDLFGSIDLTKRPVRDLTVQELLDAGAAQIDSRFADTPDIAAELHAALGASYVALELPANAQLGRALDLYESHQGVGAAPTLAILAQLLSVKQTPEQLDAVVAHAEKALAQGRRRYGEANEAVLQLRLKLALGRFHQGEWTRAVQELSALAADMDRFTAAAPHFDGELSRLIGTGLFYVADYEHSERWLRRAQAEADRAPLAPGTLAASVHMSLGALYCETQRFAEAERELDSALKEALRWVPDDSATTLQIRRDQAQLRLEEGRAPEAAGILEGLLSVLSSSPHSTDREGSSLIRYYLGIAYQSLNRVPEAVDTLRGAVERSEAVNGPDYPLTEQMRIALADALRVQGGLDEAHALLARVAARGLPGLPPDHPIGGELRRVQGLLLAQLGDTVGARAALAEALRIFTVRYGAAHWRTQRARAELARLT